MIKNNKVQSFFKLGIGITLLLSVILGYYKIPQHMNEYTFISNSVESITLIVAGVFLLAKRKNIPTYIDLCLAILALIMLGIVFTNYQIFGFDGAYLFLHVINPILVFLHWVFVTEKGKVKNPKYVLAAAILPIMYISFLLVFGYITGNYIYPIFDVNALGSLHVAIFIFAIAVFYIGVAYALYFADKAIGRKRSKDR